MPSQLSNSNQIRVTSEFQPRPKKSFRIRGIPRIRALSEDRLPPDALQQAEAETVVPGRPRSPQKAPLTKPHDKDHPYSRSSPEALQGLHADRTSNKNAMQAATGQTKHNGCAAFMKGTCPDFNTTIFNTSDTIEWHSIISELCANCSTQAANGTL